MGARRKRLIASAAACAIVAMLAALVWALAGSGSPAETTRLRVVAAENVWGSIAAQLAGPSAMVSSIVANPAADPHDYEPTAADARTLADAQLVIVNGAGYDPWAQRLLAANPVAGRRVIDVGKLAHVERGGNPHLWYAPAVVAQVAQAIAAAYRAEGVAVRRLDLAAYHGAIARIRARFAGTPVGASESIFAPLAGALGLRVLTPTSFVDAIGEGAEPTARDLTMIERQIERHAIRVWVYNSQNATPDVRRVTEAARRARISVVTVTETLSPANATFQSWQIAQLRALQAALER